jgi:hypothetical protein
MLGTRTEIEKERLKNKQQMLEMKQNLSDTCHQLSPRNFKTYVDSTSK